jgi:glutamate racemase
VNEIGVIATDNALSRLYDRLAGIEQQIANCQGDCEVLEEIKRSLIDQIEEVKAQQKEYKG